MKKVNTKGLLVNHAIFQSHVLKVLITLVKLSDLKFTKLLLHLFNYMPILCIIIIISYFSNFM